MERIRASEFGAQTRVLSIGIGQFSDPQIETLEGAEREARAFASALADPDGCAIPRNQVKVVSGLVTSAEVVAHLRSAAEECPVDSVLVVYFSGHAFRDTTGMYLCGCDAQKADLRSTSISSVEVDEALSSCHARGVLLILDCCVSAGLAERAPAFFRRTQGADFRVLLAASREDQPSWEVGNGEGTLFSKYLIEIVSGRIPVGLRPGEISLTDLVDGIDFHVNEDLRAVHPAVPAQQPIVAGSFSRDPVLFFHRSLALTGLTVEKDRVSRALHRRVIRRLVMAGVITAVFGFLTYLTWLDKHFYATADSNIVRIYRGYPGWGGPGFPKLVWEEPISATAFRGDSPLKTGGVLISPLDRPIEPLINLQLNDVAIASRLREAGNTREARERLLRLLDRDDLSPEASIFAKLLLAEVATSADLPKLRDLVNDPRPEIRTSSIRAMLRIAPEEGFASLINALSESNKFDQRALINEIPFPCPKGADAYFDAASRSAEFNGVYSKIADSAFRAGCHISENGLIAMSRFWPVYELSDLANYAELFRETIPAAALQGEPVRGAFLNANNACAIGSATRRLREAPGPVSQHEAELLLLSPGCKHNEQVNVAIDKQRILKVGLTGTPYSFEIPPSVKADIGIVLVSFLEARADSVAFTFLEEVVRNNPDSLMKAHALETLVRSKRSFRPSNSLLNSGNLQLRRAAYAALAEVDHRAAFESIRSRINDQDLVDWPELAFSAHPTPGDLELLRPFLRGGAREKERAASIFAMLGSPEDLRALTADPVYDVRHAVRQYVGGNRELLHFKVSGTQSAYNDFDAIVSTAQTKRRNLERELDAVPPGMQVWRVREILKSRGNSFDTSFRQVLDPGLKLWLAEKVQSLDLQ